MDNGLSLRLGLTVYQRKLLGYGKREVWAYEFTGKAGNKEFSAAQSCHLSEDSLVTQ